ncbi:MAG: hypothetical protein ACQEQV_08495 [Fibrobacterota bacterium]
MKALYTHHYSATETYTASKAILSTLSGSRGDSDILTAAREKLAELHEELRQSIAFHDRPSLPAESRELDGRFNTGFRRLRDYVELTAEMEELGQRAEYAAEIRAIIQTHGRRLYEKPKSEQIVLFDSILQELSPRTLDGAGVTALITSLREVHEELRAIEKERREVAAARRMIPGPYALSRKIHPLLTLINTHIENGALLLPEVYGPTRRVLNVKLSPLIQRVRSRRTRAGNEV